MRAALACGLALAALAGCGGGDDEGGGAKTDGGAPAGGAAAEQRYAAEVNAFCERVQQSVKDVQGDLTEAQREAGTDAEAAGKAVGGALRTFAGDIDGALDDLRGAEVPPDFRRFHDGAVSGLDRVVTALEDAGGKAEDGDVAALGTLGQTLGDVEVPDPPAALRREAPACQALSRAQGATAG